MAQVLCDAGNHVLMWGRSQELVDEVNEKHTNSKYLDENILPVGLKATTDLSEAFEYSNIYVLRYRRRHFVKISPPGNPWFNPTPCL